MRFVSACLLFFAIFFVKTTITFAHTEHLLPEATEGQINEALMRTVPLRFLPSNRLYFLITAKETASRFFKPSAAARAEFDMVLGGKRLKETYLLLKNGGVGAASENMGRYSRRLNKMVGQIERARSQNQDVTSLMRVMAESLRVHETLLFATQKELKSVSRSHEVDENFDETIESFIAAVSAIDNVVPGLKDRFKTITEPVGSAEETQQAPTPIYEATPSVKPRRIIF